MTKDTIVFGSLAGFIGNIPKIIFTWILHFLGYDRYTFIHIAAGFFVPAKYLDKPLSLMIGVISDFIMAGLFGVVLLLIMRKTGSDFPILKGVGFSAVIYLFIYGMLMALDITRASLLTPLPNLLLLFPHLILGIVSAWFIKYYDGLERVKPPQS